MPPPVNPCKRDALKDLNSSLENAMIAAFLGALLLLPVFKVITVAGAAVYAGDAISDYNDRIEECDNVSPLMLDLDGDGIETDAITFFDHEGDGWNELSRWANEDNG